MSVGVCPLGCTLCRRCCRLCILGAWNRTERREKGEEIDDGNCRRCHPRRDLPLFSCSCTSHRLHESASACVVQQELEHLLRRLLVFCVCRMVGHSETGLAALAVVVVAANAGWDPWTRTMKVTGRGAGA